MIRLLTCLVCFWNLHGSKVDSKPAVLAECFRCLPQPQDIHDCPYPETFSPFILIISHSLTLYEGRYGSYVTCMWSLQAVWLCMFWRLQHAYRLHRYRLEYSLYLSPFCCNLSGSNFLCPNGSLHNFLHVTDKFMVKSLVCVSLYALLSYDTNLCGWKLVSFILLDIESINLLATDFFVSNFSTPCI